MTVIRIREQPGAPEGANAELSFDHTTVFPVTVTDPFSDTEEQRLEWYFEHWLRRPYLNGVTARAAAVSIRTYGETLFSQVFAHPDAVTRFQQLDLNTLVIEISGSPAFQRLHWEALKAPQIELPLSLRAPIVRKNLTPPVTQPDGQRSPTINLLLVAARPDVEADVGYRTISRPLVESLRQAQLWVRVDIVRPGTYRAFLDHLDEITDREGSGFYHLVHFDLHGGLLDYEAFQKGVKSNRFLYQARYGRNDIEDYDGLKAFLFFETDAVAKQTDPVEAGELAERLRHYRIPITILNACQSAKQIGATETSLGHRLMQAGVQTVVAMSYSVTVSAAEQFMTRVYEQLFAEKPLKTAIRYGRQRLYDAKTRRAYFNQQIDLEDWLLPVVYENQDQPLPLREPTPEETQTWYDHQAGQYTPPQPTYGFWGRDLDVLRIEKQLLKHNLLLVRGMGGAGKTTLLRHLGHWWQTTRFIDQVFEFGYDTKAWTCEQIVKMIAERLLDAGTYHGTFLPMPDDTQQRLVADRLNSQRHLLILDNLESITGHRLAIRHTLSKPKRQALKAFLALLNNGKTLVLLGSRANEAWLMDATFGENVYELPGLDPEAASDFADRILMRHNASQHRESTAFLTLLERLNGYPLPMEVVLANLARQSPEDVLVALKAGDVTLDSGDAQTKTDSILRCIEYSHSNLSADAQRLLQCLAPFTGVIFTQTLPQYIEQLKQQPTLAKLPFDRWNEILQDAVHWGLLSPHPELPAFLQLQPIFPYFLQTRLHDQAEVQEAIQAAFRAYYDELAVAIVQLLNAKEAEKKQTGQVLARLEYENLNTVLTFALEAQTSILNPYLALSNYLDTTHEEARGLALGESVLKELENYSESQLVGLLGAEFVGVIDDIAYRQLSLKKYSAAENSYQRALQIPLNLKGFTADQQNKLSAGIYHQLGRVAQEQRQWPQAEEYYQKALAIYIEFDDRDEQARTYHQLGRVAQEQRQWPQAEEYYQKALAIYIEFDDRYSQARTYHQLGSVAQEQRQWPQAEEYYQKALAINIEFDDRYEQARTYHQLGSMAQEQRQWPQAEEYYQKALAIKIEFDDRHEQASTYHNLGSVAQEQRQWPQAEEYYQKALAIKIEFDDRYEQARTYHHLGMVAQEQRQWPQAEEYYQKALAIKIEFDDRYSQARTYHNLGRVAQDQRQWPQALDYFLKDLTILALNLQTKKGSTVTLRSLARLWQASEDDSLPVAVAVILEISPEDVVNLLEKLVTEED